MKTMCPPGCHHSGIVATHALGHIIPKNQRVLKKQSTERNMSGDK